MLIYTLFFIMQVAAVLTGSVEDQSQNYGKRLHPPLVRMIRSLEDELRSLPNENVNENDQDFPVATESSDIHFENNVGDFSKSSESDNFDGNSDFISNPAATEFLPASTPTPQLVDMEKTVSPSSLPSQDHNSNLNQNAKDSVEVDNESEENEDDEDEEEGHEDSQMVTGTTVAPAYVKDVYFLAREEKPGKLHEETAVNVARESETDHRPAIYEPDLAPDGDIDQSLANYEQQRQTKKSDGNNIVSNNYSNTSSELELADLRNNPQNEDSQKAGIPTDDQYNYEAKSDDASLEIDITEDEDPSEVQEKEIDAENGENYEGAGDYDNSSSVAGNWEGSIVTPVEYENDKKKLENEILERLRMTGMDKRTIEKKSTMRHSKSRKLAGKASENEDILQLMIKVAEDPKDWEEIRELLEKIQFDEATLKKAKSRLRALAKQQKIKNNRNNKGKDTMREQKLTKGQSRTLENDVVSKSMKMQHLKNPAKIYASKTANKTSKLSSKSSTDNKNSPTGEYIKVSVFPAQKNAERNKLRTTNGRRPPNTGHKEEHFAIEKPVTVIGERSKVDPVEKQLVEASTNQRIRELQMEKARLAAAGQPTDEMEEQLKGLTKLERRLKEHWRQKQKLLQKIQEKEQRRQAAMGVSNTQHDKMW